MKVTRNNMLLICAGIAIMSLIASNIITNKQFNIPLIGWAITCGSICVPLSYIVDDILAEVYGFKIARLVIYIGFIMNAIAVIYFQLAIAIPGAETFTGQESFEIVLGATWRTTFASFIAYLSGSMANAKIMDVLHIKNGDSKLATRCILSTIAGELLDMAIFAVIAFYSVFPLEIIGQMIITNSCAKIIVEIVLYPIVTKHVIRWAKSLE